MANTVGTLNEQDIADAFRSAVPPWRIEHLDTKLGTAEVVKILKDGGNGSYGGVGPCEDGPYDRYSRRIDREAKGFRVKVKDKRGKTEKIIREGMVTWNQLANMATGAALELQRKIREEMDEVTPEQQEEDEKALIAR